MPRARATLRYTQRNLSMKFKVKEGYLGQCGKCLDEDATHAEYLKFEQPAIVEGVWHYVCDGCCDSEAEHKKG